MKKNTVTFLIFLSCFYFVTAQSKINGLGIFKINQTQVSIIDSLTCSGYSLVECNEPKHCPIGYSSSNTIYELKKQSAYTTYYPLIDELQVFVLNKYPVADFEIKELYLSFYNGILYQMKTSKIHPLVDKLGQKYESTIKGNTKEIKCSSIYGEFKREESSFITTYRKDEIEAYSYLNKWYDGKCKEDYLAFFIIYDKQKNNIVDEKEKVIKEEIKKTEQIERQNKLKEL